MIHRKHTTTSTGGAAWLRPSHASACAGGIVLTAALSLSTCLVTPHPAVADPAASSPAPALAASESAPATTAAPVVAIALPLTGPRQSLGVRARSAVEAMASPGMASVKGDEQTTGRAYEMAFIDDGCNRNRATTAAREIAALKPAVVIGHPCATAAEASATTYHEAGVLFIAAGARHPELTRKRAGPLIFRMAGRDDHQGRDAGVRLRELAGEAGRIGIVHDRTQMAKAIADAAARSAASTNAPAPLTLGIVAGEIDYSRAIAELNAQPAASAVLFAGFPAEAALILRQLRRSGSSARLLVIDAAATSEFVGHAGIDLDHRVEAMLPVAADYNRAPVVAASAEDTAVADIVAAVHAWRDAVTATDSTDPAIVAQQLTRKRDHIEEVTFDVTGDARVPGFAAFAWSGIEWRRAGRIMPPARTTRSN